ncbi:MAG TPA: hypothetical protein VIN60_04705 [Anaerolineales bacterium]
MNKRIGILSIFLIFILGCSFLASPPPTASPVPPSQTPQSPTAIPPTSTIAPTQPASLGTIALDFVALLCDAKWMNGAQHLTACPTANADHSGGYAQSLDPASEDLPANAPTLLTIPAWSGGAALFLRYPPFTVHTADRFRATLRCQVNAPCDVEYALEYYDANGKYHSPFLSWTYQAGTSAINVDADLSGLAGQTVDFVLALRPNNDTPQQDYSLWIAPVIYHPNP